MENVIMLNKEVNVVAYYFKNAGARLKCFPKRMELDGKRVEFSETGLRHPTKKGERTIHIFDMTDGQADYRLEFDDSSYGWKLVSMAGS